MNVGELFVKLTLDKTDFDKALKNIDASVREFASSSEGLLSGVNDKFMASSRAMAGVVTGAVTGAVVGLGAAVKSTVGNAMDFEQTIANLQSVSNASAEDLDRLKNVAMEMGAKTAFTAQQAAEGMIMLSTAGFNTNEQIEAIGPTLNLASAAGIELSRAADITTNVLGGMNLATSETNRVVDVLAHVAAASNTNVDQLGEALKYAAPIAAQAGYSIEDAATMIGVLSDAGIQASEAGTGLRRVIQRIASPTDAAREAMANLNIVTRDNTGALLPMTQLIPEIEGKMANLSKAEQDRIKFLIFGTEGQGAYNILAARGAEEIANLTEKTEASTGAADKMAATMLGTTKGSLEQLTSAVDGISLAIGDKLLPYFRDFIDWLTKLAIDAMPYVISVMDWLVETIDTKVIPSFSSLIDFVKNLIKENEPLIDDIKNNLIPILRGIGLGIVTTVLPAMASLALSFAGILGPISLVIQIVTALSLAWEENFGGIQESTKELIAVITRIVTQISAAFVPVIKTLIQWAITLAIASIPLITDALEWLEDTVVNTVIPSIEDIINYVKEFIRENQPLINDIKNNLIPILKGIALAITVMVLPAIVSMVASLATLLAPIAAIIAASIALSVAWENDWNGIKTTTLAIVDKIKEFVTSAIAFIQKFWDDHGTEIMLSIKYVWNRISEIIGLAIEVVSTIVVTVLTYIQKFIKDHGDTIVAVFKLAFDNIKTILSVAFEIIQSILQAALALMRGDFRRVFEEIGQIISNILNAIANIIRNTLNIIAIVWLELWGGMVKNLSTMAYGMIDAVREFTNWLALSIPNALSNMYDNLLNAVYWVSTAASRIGQGIIDGIAFGIQNGIDYIAQMARDAAWWALEAAKNALGINSPSKVFEEEIGGGIVEGMALGLQNVNPIEQAMNTLMDSVIPAQGMTTQNTSTNWNVNIQTAQPINSVLSGLELRQSLSGR